MYLSSSLLQCHCSFYAMSGPALLVVFRSSTEQCITPLSSMFHSSLLTVFHPYNHTMFHSSLLTVFNPSSHIPCRPCFIPPPCSVSSVQPYHVSFFPPSSFPFAAILSLCYCPSASYPCTWILFLCTYTKNHVGEN